MDFFFIPHQHKGTAFLDALTGHGAKRVRRVDRARFGLMDFLYSGVFSGVNGRGRLRQEARDAHLAGIPIFLYPHSYSAALPYDMEKDPMETRAFFVPSRGFAEVLQLIKYPTQAVEVGWSYSDVNAFERCTAEKPKVLYAPLHPVGGELPQVERDINRHTFELLLAAKKAGAIESLTVRFYGNAQTGGFPLVNGVTYRPALLNGSTADIEAADIVVSAGTFAYMAVALGKPTVMMGQEIRPHNSPRGGGMLVWVKHWELYKDLVQFPDSIEMTTTLEKAIEVLRRAGEREPEGWKRTHIGEPFDATRFTLKLEALL